MQPSQVPQRTSVRYSRICNPPDKEQISTANGPYPLLGRGPFCMLSPSKQHNGQKD
jgi:hypothetical protein